MYIPDDLLQFAGEHEFLAYAVEDVKSHSFSCPAFWRTPVDAVRNFESSVIAQSVAQEGLFFTHPDDYYFCVVGGFDSATGVLVHLDPIRLESPNDVIE